MEVKPGYKQTEAGVIPNDWDAPELGFVLKSLQLGGNYKNGARENQWPLIKMGNLGRGSIKLDKLEFIQPPHVPAARDRLEPDDVLFNTRNTLDLVGKIAIWRGELPEAYFNSNIARMNFEGQYVSSRRFMNYILNTPLTIKSLRGIATGTTSVAAIYGRDLGKIRVPLPSKTEQEAIAEVLSDADSIVESLEHLLVKKRQLKQGAMQELLTAKRRLPGFSGEWPKHLFGDIAQPRKERIDPRRTGKTEFCVELEHIEQGTGRLVGFSSAGKDSSLKSVFWKDDVLFGKLRAYLRKYWLADREGVCSTEIWAMVARRSLVTPQYLFQILKVDSFIEVASTAYGTHMPRSDWGVVKNYQVRLPARDEQAAIADVLGDMDADIDALETKLAKARQLKQGMMQELLTGKTRLI